ncbi:MAG: hypothetical protein JWR04_2264 [Rhodoglobus sp.]|nr:hypothetical protein [Rhodoglobus sp.]
MGILLERVAALAAVLFLALALTTEPAAIVAAVATVVLITAMAALVVGSREMTVGSRAHAHREAMTSLPAPAHPSTAGRPRTRAPSTAVPAT